MAHGKVEKTNAARLLDRAKITYELVPYRVDEEHLAATLPAIYISAGVRGLQLKIAPAELIAFVGATVAEISRRE